VVSELLLGGYKLGWLQVGVISGWGDYGVVMGGHKLVMGWLLRD